MRYVISILVMLAAVTCAVAFAAPAASEKAATVSAPADKIPEEGFTVLFNGKDLTGWDGNPKYWSVKDGCIHGETSKDNPLTGSNTFITWQGGKPADFELRLSCKMVGGNSGIQYRSFERPQKWVVGGYQMEVSTDKRSAGFLYGEQFRGGAGLCNVGEKVVWKGGKQVTGKLGDQAEIASHFKLNDWNDYRIVCQGNHVQQFLNGIQTVDFTDEDPTALLSGIICLQVHAGYVMTVDFKNIQLKVFPKAGEAKKS
jgi:hypothetical protein